MNNVTETKTGTETPTISTANQKFPGFTVTIKVATKGPTAGTRYALILPDSGSNSHVVPVELLSLTAGRDAWMKNILVRCSVCRVPTKAGEMECNMCEGCYEEAGEENARLDRGE
jgi:hypothetical protein